LIGIIRVKAEFTIWTGRDLFRVVTAHKCKAKSKKQKQLVKKNMNSHMHKLPKEQSKYIRPTIPPFYCVGLDPGARNLNPEPLDADDVCMVLSNLNPEPLDTDEACMALPNLNPEPFDADEVRIGLPNPNAAEVPLSADRVPNVKDGGGTGVGALASVICRTGLLAAAATSVKWRHSLLSGATIRNGELGGARGM